MPSFQTTKHTLAALQTFYTGFKDTSAAVAKPSMRAFSPQMEYYVFHGVKVRGEAFGIRVYMPRQTMKQFVATIRPSRRRNTGQMMEYNSDYLLNAMLPQRTRNEQMRDIAETVEQLVNNPLYMSRRHYQFMTTCCFCGHLLGKERAEFGYGEDCAEIWRLPRTQTELKAYLQLNIPLEDTRPFAELDLTS